MAMPGCINDNSFGPIVEGCRGDFDFTFRFQRIILGIVPAAIFIPIALIRVASLALRPRIVGGKTQQFAKLSVIAITAGLQLVLLILSATSNDGSADIFAVASSALAFVESLVILALSFTEHSRAARPSSILTMYLLLQILFGVAQCRSYWLMASSFRLTRYAGIMTATLPLKVIVLILELQSKARWMKWTKEDHSPEETSSLFNLGVYFWLIRIFRNGFKNMLSIKEDLYVLDHEMQSKLLLDKLTTQFAKSSADVGKRFRLAKALAKALVVPLLLPVVPRLAMIAFQYSQPFFIHALLEYLLHKDVPKNHGYGLIGAAAIIYAGIAISDALFWYFHQRALYMARGCLAAYVYRSTTEGKMTDISDAAVLTVMSTDVERVLYGFHGLHDFWANIIEIGLGCFLLERELGLAFISPIVVILLCVLVTSIIAWLVGERQSRWMARIESRVGLTSSIISNIKSLRISGITTPVRDLVQKMREQELKIGNKFRWLLILTATTAFVPTTVSPVVAFAFTNEQLDTLKIFVSFSFILLLTNPLSQMFQSVPAVIAAFVCLERIQKFLEMEPSVDYRKSSLSLPPADDALLGQYDEKMPTDSRQIASKSRISVINGSFGWTSEKMTLKNISVDVPVGKLTIIIGPVASGKSTFCKALLGEVPFSSGEVILPWTQAAIGYCEQTPFLKNGSIRDSIIWHSVYNQKRYDEVLDACLLRTDLNILPEGDATIIGSNGIMLSGGQKQRISLARALYLETGFLIIDDILSGLDNSTGNDVFQRVFGPEGLLRRRGATAILCTHAIRYLPLADHIVAFEADGTVNEQGSFEKLVETGKYVQSLGVSIADDAFETDAVTPVEEPVAATVPVPLVARPVTTIANLESQSRATGDSKVYRHYYRSVSGWASLTCVLTGILYAVGRNFPSIWMGWWGSDAFHMTPSFYIGIMGLFRGLQVVALFLCAIAVVISMTTQSGSQLHRAILDTLVNAPLSFFTTTDFGAVTNLFSQDMTLIDGELPISLLNTVIQFFDVITMAIVVAVGTPWLAISYPFVFAVIYMLQMFYLRTSRQLRLLDLEAKSPLYDHFLDTIRGIATIRALKLGDKEIFHNQNLLDTSQRPAYLLAMSQRFLASSLNLMVMVMAVGVVTLATQLRTNSGFAGSSLVTLMTWGESISSLIQYYTQVEISIGAVSRLKAFAENVASENLDGEDLEPPEEWPAQGKIEIRGISASYKNEDASDNEIESPNLALEDVTISVKPRQKVALCGRTGSGKSSVILLLLRLLDPLSNQSENIEIDGVPYNRVDRSVLRRRIIAVPQDPVFLPDGSSIKDNLDPFNLASDMECLAVLEDVRLEKFANDRGTIHAGMRTDELSAGQKQLFSLGRALLRRRVKQRLSPNAGGVLLLDEVSSSVDSATDNLVQRIITDEFSDYTIVMVSHRLNIVVEYFDSVVILDRGRVVETGCPLELARNDSSWFNKLWSIEKKDED
ncbi:P-loop containing nucleoside triphosphate hydrolase protein [Fusarium tricinctum]|uniref:P-loop containing nucleoside triphosphate hydrolase protein n=1 Tax=Fusarium tricinctum TaxID=61284 RepID=A0A8K0WGM3_9HYPO|nr:P-loop containing nucleoside triphosphate hydrolase protein [Fusarium tricinctum]